MLDKEGLERSPKEEITTVPEGSGSGVNDDRGGDEFGEGPKAEMGSSSVRHGPVGRKTTTNLSMIMSYFPTVANRAERGESGAPVRGEMGKAEGFPRLCQRGCSQMSQPGRRKTRKHHAGLVTFYFSPHSPRFTPGLLRAQSRLPWATSLDQSRSPLASRFRLALPKGLPGLGGEGGEEVWGFLPISLL